MAYVEVDTLLNALSDDLPYKASVKRVLMQAPEADVVEVKHGYWIHEPPYYDLNGKYRKGSECSSCHTYFVSNGNEPYSDHPYCCECGAKMDGELNCK